MESLPKKGIDGVADYPFKGSKPRLSEEEAQTLLQSLKEDQVSTLHQAAELIKQKTGVSYCDSAVWFVFKRLGIKKKTGRPANVRKDKEGAETFKKKHLP
ncbi:MAG: winged helix-turn-helix domain-containing protein [Flavisolibacter sp.]|nr:winged helix-turn-helix domain-containing protein [Flavisolibacter sp.]